MTTYLEGRMTFDKDTLDAFLTRMGSNDCLIVESARIGIRYADGHEEFLTPEKVKIIRQIERAE